MAQAPDFEIQTKGINLVRETFDDYSRLSVEYRERLVEVYKAFSTYTERRQADWATDFKINKSHEVVEKVLPRIIAKNPKWIVVPRTNDFTPEELPPIDNEDPQSIEARKLEIEKRQEQTLQFSRGIQDYLSYIFDEYNIRKVARLSAKNMVVYGPAWAKIKYKYEKVVVTDVINGKEETKSDISGEYPTIDIKSWTEMYWDPRYRFVSDMPAVVEISNGVRLEDLKRNK